MPWETGAAAPATHSRCSPKPLTRAVLPAATCPPGRAEPCDPSPASCGKTGCGGTGDLVGRAFSRQMAEDLTPPPSQAGSRHAPTPWCGWCAGPGAGGARERAPSVRSNARLSPTFPSSGQRPSARRRGRDRATGTGRLGSTLLTTLPAEI